MNELSFNPKFSTIMHFDLNSCFATIEQQANPLLRGKPIAVAAYNSPNGCILAPSIEAKKFGVKTGMRVKEGKLFCPNLMVLSSDPWKYRNIHLRLRKLISDYTDDFSPKSIDEFVLNLENYPCMKIGISKVAKQIKSRIKKEIGEWLTVSVGIAPNRFLAKLAAGLHKPDGLDAIDKANHEKIYKDLELTDLPYIKLRNAVRLNSVGIFTVMDFYQSPLWKLKAAFASINGYYWYLRLRGWEIDDVEFGRRSYGNSYSLPKPLTTLTELSPVLCKLVEKTGSRLRRAGYSTRGVHVAVNYRDGDFWHHGAKLHESIFDSRDIYKKALGILALSGCRKAVRNLAVSVFNINNFPVNQLNLFSDMVKRRKLSDSIDAVNERWGSFVVTPARMNYLSESAVPDRIAFGGVKELEEFIQTD